MRRAMWRILRSGGRYSYSVLVGDAKRNPLRLMPALDRYGEQHGGRVLLAVKIDCMGLATSPVGTHSATDPCVQWSAAPQRRLLSMADLDAVIFAGHIGAVTRRREPGSGDAPGR